MYSNEEFKNLLCKVHPEYFDFGKNGVKKWKTARIFSTILYPENISDINDCCNKLSIPCCLSPLHNQDVKESGEIKKEHYHLIIYYAGKTTPYSCYTSLCGAFGESAFSTLEIGKDLGALVQYHIHLNNPEKFQYNASDILDFNGFSSSKYLVSGAGDIMDNFRQIKKIIKNNNFLFYNDLDDFLDENEPLLYSAMLHDRVLARQCKDYMKAREYQMLYDGNIERSQIKIRMSDGSEKVIFNRELKQA